MNQKNKKIIDHIIKVMDTLDPSGANSARYKNFFKNMTDKAFDRYMKLLKEGKVQIYAVFPNLKRNMEMVNILNAAKITKTKLFQRLWMTDESTGRKFLTPEEYPVFNVSIRVAQQIVDKKISVPESDTTIDGLTGQVIGDDRAASISNPEIQALFAQGLDTTLVELIKVRGGDIHAYNEFKRQMEESGVAELSRLSPSKTRSVVMTDVFMAGMGFETNFAED